MADRETAMLIRREYDIAAGGWYHAGLNDDGTPRNKLTISEAEKILDDSGGDMGRVIETLNRRYPRKASS